MSPPSLPFCTPLPPLAFVVHDRRTSNSNLHRLRRDPTGAPTRLGPQPAARRETAASPPVASSARPCAAAGAALPSPGAIRGRRRCRRRRRHHRGRRSGRRPPAAVALAAPPGDRRTMPAATRTPAKADTTPSTPLYYENQTLGEEKSAQQLPLWSSSGW